MSASDQPTVRVLHLSDLALSASPDADAGTRAVEALLHDLRHLPAVDLVVVSGDVTADGTSTAYVAARRLVGALATAHDAPHVYAVGDRDDPLRFAEVLGSGHLGPDEIDVGGSGPAARRHGWVSRAGDLRVITLDTRVAGAQHGEVGEAQARWLAEVLSAPAPGGTVLVLHHPPAAPASHPHLADRTLADVGRLADVVRGTDVQVVLAGHLGIAMSATLGGVPVVVAPGAVGRTDLTCAPHLDRVVHEGGATVVELGGPCSPLQHTLWSRRPATARRVDQRDSRSGAVERREAVPVAAAVSTTAPSALEDTVTWRPDDVAAEPAAAATEDPAPRADDDSGVLSWAFDPDRAPDEERSDAG